MTANACITTSWDDGHPLDLRVAEMLCAYGLRGTFYVPRAAERATMSPAQLRQLSSQFELGGHTLNHIDLTRADERIARQEIRGCRMWLQDATGQACSAFCPPQGRFRMRHLPMVADAGYVAMRTVELMSLAWPKHANGLVILPTTVQAYSRHAVGYLRNALRRASIGNFYRFIVFARGCDWDNAAASLLNHALKAGGVFHLWGHSWEIEATGQWQRLDRVLRLLASMRSKASFMTNAELCAASVSRIAENNAGIPQPADPAIQNI